MTNGSGQALREALTGYVRALHEAYLGAVQRRGAPVEATPLARAPFTVAVVAAERLHLVATRQQLPPRRSHEQVADERLGPLEWQVRFFDRSVLPELGEPWSAATGGDGGEPDVLALLGITDSLYHLMVELQAALTPHQALHAGTGLANAHLGNAT